MIRMLCSMIRMLCGMLMLHGMIRMYIYRYLLTAINSYSLGFYSFLIRYDEYTTIYSA
jgi:hypothetical protein